MDLKDKWVATISTQKGCPMRCSFCDVPLFGYHGNCDYEDLKYQIKTIIENEDIRYTERFNVHFARMGEPTFNKEVLRFSYDLRDIIKEFELQALTIHPVISTMLPKSNKNLIPFLLEWCNIKNNIYKGEAGLQFSINSTDNIQRDMLFQGRSLYLEDISHIGKLLPIPVGRKYTLNFPVTKETILNPLDLSKLFDKDKFIVKITPIHETKTALSNNFDIDGYSNYNVYRKFEEPLLNEGWEVIVFVPSIEEDSDRITCGNALITNNNK